MVEPDAITPEQAILERLGIVACPTAGGP